MFAVEVAPKYCRLVCGKFNVFTFFVAAVKVRVGLRLNNVPLTKFGSRPNWVVGAKLRLMEFPNNSFISFLEVDVGRDPLLNVVLFAIPLLNMLFVIPPLIFADMKLN